MCTRILELLKPHRIERNDARPDLRYTSTQKTAPRTGERGTVPPGHATDEAARTSRPPKPDFDGPTLFGIPVWRSDRHMLANDFAQMALEESKGDVLGAIKVMRERNTELLHRAVMFMAFVAVLATIALGIGLQPALLEIKWLRNLLAAVGVANITCLLNLGREWVMFLPDRSDLGSLDHLRFIARHYVRRCLIYNVSYMFARWSVPIVAIGFLATLIF
jgi:hypothetical protein